VHGVGDVDDAEEPVVQGNQDEDNGREQAGAKEDSEQKGMAEVGDAAQIGGRSDGGRRNGEFESEIGHAGLGVRGMGWGHCRRSCQLSVFGVGSPVHFVGFAEF